MNIKKENKTNKRMIGLNVSEDVYKALEEVCADYGANVSTVCRMIIVDYLKRYKGDLLDSIRKEEN